MKTPIDILKTYWGYDSFREPQLEIINSILEGNKVLALLPTGGGKSICYQVPGLILDGITIVISPLIALMKDQVKNLQDRGIRAAGIYSGMKSREIDIALDNCIYGEYKFLYVSPERLKTEMFQYRAGKMKIGLLAVDEAHCISQWGYDFRPSYLEIHDFISQHTDLKTIAVTATATKKVQEDIVDKLGFTQYNKFQISFARSNLSYSIRQAESKEEKLLEILSNVNGTGIIYVNTRKRTVEIAKMLAKHKISSNFYHGGLTHEERDERQKKWTSGEIRIIVSTNAFGMGIDKPDVRIVVHMDIPPNLESYYQEAGRAGRDGKKAFAVILYHESDIEEIRKKVLRGLPDRKFIVKIYDKLSNYYQLAVDEGEMKSFDFELDEFITYSKTDVVETFNAIKYLGEAGFILLSEGYFEQSRLIFLYDDKALQNFMMSNPKSMKTIEAILRIYGGEVFSNYTSINENKIAKLLELELEESNRRLQIINKQGVLNYVPRSDTPKLTFIKPRQRKLRLKSSELDSKRKSELQKIESVIEYIKHRHRCRTQLLLEYFGETSYEKCGICDYCSDKPEEIKDYNKISSQIINFLSKSPMPLSLLLQQFQKVQKDQFSKILRQMLENSEIRYNKEGNLTLN